MDLIPNSQWEIVRNRADAPGAGASEFAPLRDGDGSTDVEFDRASSFRPSSCYIRCEARVGRIEIDQKSRDSEDGWALYDDDSNSDLLLTFGGNAPNDENFLAHYALDVAPANRGHVLRLASYDSGAVNAAPPSPSVTLAEIRLYACDAPRAAPAPDLAEYGSTEAEYGLHFQFFAADTEPGVAYKLVGRPLGGDAEGAFEVARWTDNAGPQGYNRYFGLAKTNQEQQFEFYVVASNDCGESTSPTTAVTVPVGTGANPYVPTGPGAPDPFICAPSVTFETPDAGAQLARFARVRVAVSDPNEETDPCSKNYDRPCNHEADGAALRLWLGDFEIIAQWKLENGTPLNGVYATWIDTRDLANGAKTLKVSARGVGCCRAEATRSVTLANSLFANVFYRDIRRSARADLVIGRAHIGIEVRALEENLARRYWVQHGARSGTELDGPYKHEDWHKHQPVLLEQGEKQNAQGARIARQQYNAPIVLPLPHKPEMRVRQKWTAQFYLAAFDTGSSAVAKIREIEPGRHLVWTSGAARAWVYDGETLGPLFVGADNDAGDAIDGALLDDKLFVVRPSSDDNPRGELFAYDTDAGQVAMLYTVRGETRAPRFVERVGARVLALYVDAEQAPATRCYDLSFGAPRLAWQLAAPVTFCAPVAGGLAVAIEGALWTSADGLAAPALSFEFPAPVRAVSVDWVGLENGQVWKRAAAPAVVLQRAGAVTGVATWSAGTTGEVAGQETARGVVGGASSWLSGERGNGTWYDEVELTLPLDLSSKTVDAVSALELFAVDLPPIQGDTDAAPAPQRDERLLIGTRQSGLFFVYQRSALSERDGAIATSHDTAPRVFPFPMLPAISKVI